MTAIVKTLRREAGFYLVTLDDGRVLEICNMQGQAVRYTGVGAHWHVRKPSRPFTILHEAWTLKEAREWITTQ